MKKYCFPLISLFLLWTFLPFMDAAENNYSIVCPSPNSFVIADSHGSQFEIQFVAWGANWAFAGVNGEVTSQNGIGQHHLTARLKTGANLTFDATVKLEKENSLVVETTMTSNQETDLTLAGLALVPDKTQFIGGHLAVTKGDGSKSELPLPLQKIGPGGNTTTLAFSTASGSLISAQLNPAAMVTADGAARVVFAEHHIAANQPVKQTVVITLPGKTIYYPTGASAPNEPGIEKWYSFNPAVKGQGVDELSLAEWMDAPAGKQGRITRNGASLAYGGHPIRLWGINACYGSCFPDKEMAEKEAEFYSRNGINAVRLHKYADNTWGGIVSKNSFAEFDPAKLDRMDYFISKLKEKGIYVELSPTFGQVSLGGGDRAAIPYMDEFGKIDQSGRIATQNGALFLSTELQNVLIAQMTGLMNHKNPYTGLTYAKDPAVAIIELVNEDDALFFGTMVSLKRYPTLRARTAQRFTQWLKARYGTEAALADAWGNEALNGFASEGFSGESWSFEKNNLLPLGNPWFYAPEQLSGVLAPRRKRILDSMRFLYEVQNDFYTRYAKALHATGYDGELVASNWMAGSGYSHFYNLESDARIGIVDRHNYFGGVTDTMLAKPGIGILGSGMNQVSGHPFMLSEWISTFPNEFGNEGPAIIGAYGMGLQGWDASFMFQNGDKGTYFSSLGGGVWEAAAPHMLGVFPAVARQVLRGDVKTSELVSTRYVHLPSLEKGELGFDDHSTQNGALGDIKTFSSLTVPPASLAIARCAVEFCQEPHATEKFDPEKYFRDGAYESSTGQLRWHPATDSPQGGWISINTPATQAVVGFASGQRCDLGDVVISPSTPFGSVYITAQERGGTLGNTHAMIVVAMGRAHNTGMKFMAGHLLERGKGPVLLEPIVATITLKRQGRPTVYLLDHSGHRTATTLPVRNGQVSIDGARDHTPYYLITW